MSLIAGKYYRGDLKQKPAQWGPVSVVSATLRDKLERHGIPWDKVILACPLWDGVGSKIVNYSSYDIQNTITGGYNWSNCGINFNRLTSGRVEFLNQSALNPLTSDFSIITQLRKQSFGYNAGIFASLSSDPRLYIQFLSANNIRALVDDGPNVVYADSSTNINNSDKHTIAITFNRDSANGISIYLDAVDDTASRTGDLSGVGSLSYSTLYLNSYASQENDIEYNYIFYIKSALTPDQISNIYGNPYRLWQRPAFRTYFDLAEGDEIVNFVANFTNQSETQDIDKFVARALSANFSNQSSIEDIIVSISAIINLAVSLSNQSTTNNIDTAISRELAANIINQAVTQDVDVNFTRSLFCDLINQSYTPNISIALSDIINFVVSLSNQSTIPNVDKIVSRGLAVGLSGQSSTSSIDTIIDRLISVAMANQSETNDITIAISGIIALAVGLSNQSATMDIDKFIDRGLAASLTNQSLTEDIAVSLANFINLVCSISNQSDTSDISKNIIRDIYANFQNASSTNEITKIVARELNVDLTNQSLTSDDIAIILGALIISASDALGIEIINDLTEITIN